MSTRIITGEMPDIQKKYAKWAYPDESPFGEEGARKALDVPREAVCTSEHFSAGDFTELTFTWYEITIP
jgi:hypothetical protein